MEEFTDGGLLPKTIGFFHPWSYHRKGNLACIGRKIKLSVLRVWFKITLHL